MVRQPTIKSLLFLMTLVAIVASGLKGRMPSTTVARGLFIWLCMCAYLVAPIALPLLIRRLTIVVASMAVICAWPIIVLIIVHRGAVYGDYSYRAWLSSFAFVCPVKELTRLFESPPSGVWLLAPYCLAYISLAPLFALTCRLRQPQGK